MSHFTATSFVPYRRHQYKVVRKNGESLIFESWEQAQAYWFQNSAMGNLSHIDVLDKKRTKAKGF